MGVCGGAIDRRSMADWNPQHKVLKRQKKKEKKKNRFKKVYKTTKG